MWLPINGVESELMDTAPMRVSPTSPEGVVNVCELRNWQCLFIDVECGLFCPGQQQHCLVLSPKHLTSERERDMDRVMKKQQNRHREQKELRITNQTKDCTLCFKKR